MDDIGGKIAALLSDPEALENIRNMAGNLFGSVPDANTEPPQSSAMPDMDMGKLMGVLSRLKNSGEDNRTRLLLALKPHLSERRQERVDRAVKILKILDMLPLLQESGVLNFL